MSRKKFLSVQKDSSMNKIPINLKLELGLGMGVGGMNIRFQNCEKGFDIIMSLYERCVIYCKHR